MKKYRYTHLETIQTYDGDSIIFAPELISAYLKSTYIKNVLSLTTEEKSKYFEMSFKYRDLLDKVFDDEAHHVSDAGWIKRSERRTPTQEFENYSSQPKDADMTDEEHELKLQYLKEYKEWFENLEG